MRDYRLSELIELCKNTKNCLMCPALELCRFMTPKDNPDNWEMSIDLLK